MQVVLWLETAAQDLRFAWRGLAKHRGISAVIVLTLALAIGANTAIFSLMDALLLRALPVRDPGSLVLLKWSAHTRPYHGMSSYGDCRNEDSPHYHDGCVFSLPFSRELQLGVAGAAAVTAFAGEQVYNLSGHGAATTARDQLVAGNYFQLLGVTPAAGRLLLPSDDTAAAAPVTVLSYAYWQSEFGGAAGVVGQTVDLNNVPVTIVGVADRRFAGLTPGREYDGWLPLGLHTRLIPDWQAQRDAADSAWLVLIARLRPGFVVGRAQAEISGRFRNAMLAGAQPMLKAADDPAVALLPAQTALNGARGYYTRPLTLLIWTAGAILLIACANIAGLLLGRASVRQPELALRRALGAGGGRILRQLLTESLLLAALGGALGLGIAYLGAHALLAFIATSSPAPMGLKVGIDPRVLGFTAAITVAAGILFGIAPALRAARFDLYGALKSAAGNTQNRGQRPGFSVLNLASGLAVAQIALCMVVLAGAGLLVRSLENLRAIDPGFDTNNLLLFSVQPELIGYRSAALVRLYDRMRQSIGAIAGVEGVSYSESPLLAGDLSMTGFHLPGQTGPESNTDILRVGLNFFSVMGMRLDIGRGFVPTDFVPAPERTPTPPPASTPPGPPTAIIINQAFMRKYLHGNPLGQRFGDPPGTNWVVVGVVSDAKYQSLRDAVAPTVYVPSTEGFATFEVRSAINPNAVLPAVHRAVGGIDAALPLVRPTTESRTIDQLLFQERFLARLASLLGGLALLLACLGLYGLLAQDVTRRRRELGIRMALGAGRGDVMSLILRRGLRLSAAGIAIGLAAVWGLTRVLHGVLYGVGSTDPATLAAVGVLLFAVALMASYIPARRATRVDPLVAMRAE